MVLLEFVITSYSIHYTKLYDIGFMSRTGRLISGDKIATALNCLKERGNGEERLAAFSVPPVALSAGIIPDLAGVLEVVVLLGVRNNFV